MKNAKNFRKSYPVVKFWKDAGPLVEVDSTEQQILARTYTHVLSCNTFRVFRHNNAIEKDSDQSMQERVDSPILHLSPDKLVNLRNLAMNPQAFIALLMRFSISGLLQSVNCEKKNNQSIASLLKKIHLNKLKTNVSPQEVCDNLNTFCFYVALLSTLLGLGRFTNTFIHTMDETYQQYQQKGYFYQQHTYNKPSMPAFILKD